VCAGIVLCAALALLSIPSAWALQAAGHSQENADITITPAGHASLILTAKVMAASGLRLILSPEFRLKVKEEFANWVELYNK